MIGDDQYTDATEHSAMVALNVAYTASAHPEASNRQLGMVDPFEDEGIWAIVDEGCNSNTNGELWRLNAIAKWAKHGFKPVKANNRTTSFTGVGQATS